MGEMRTFALHDGFCIVHMSTKDQDADARCVWDRMAGRRPGRANCEFTDAVIVYTKTEKDPR